MLTKSGRAIIRDYGGLQALLFDAYFATVDLSDYERFPIEYDIEGGTLQTSCGQQTYMAGGGHPPTGGRMPKAKGKSTLDKERAKTEKLLKKVGYTALKEAGVESKRPDLPNLKVEKRGR